MRRFLVLGNWKMNGSRQRNAELLSDLLEQVAGVSGVDLGVCPPFPYIPEVCDALRDSSIAVGAQDAAAELEGAYTGEVSATMLSDVGCRYVLLGHSERRALFGESSGLVAEKFERALEVGLTPVLCVGEDLGERERGETLQVVELQLQAVLERCGVNALERAVLAYEPVWAIGTGRTATPDQAQQVHCHLRGVVSGLSSAVADRLRILYGGSVKPSNAGELFAMADIDGALVGGASLDAKEFVAIAEAAGS